MEDDIKTCYEGKKISYFYNPEIGKYINLNIEIYLKIDNLLLSIHHFDLKKISFNELLINYIRFYYSKDHPMKPKRVAMAHSLI